MKLVVLLMATAGALLLGTAPGHAQAPTPESTPTCPAAAAGIINGRVSEQFVDPSGLAVSPSPLSVAGATVELLEYGLAASTDANGCFAFDVPSGALIHLVTVRASASGYGSLTLANVLQFEAGGIALELELVRGGPDRVIDYCHFDVPPESAAGQNQYDVCAEEGKLSGRAAPSPGAPPASGGPPGAAGRPALAPWFAALAIAAAFAAAAAAWQLVPRRPSR